jgi:hypothetical protein
MFIVMDLHRLRVNMRFKRVKRIAKRGKFVGQGTLLFVCNVLYFVQRVFVLLRNVFAAIVSPHHAATQLAPVFWPVI